MARIAEDLGDTDEIFRSLSTRPSPCSFSRMGGTIPTLIRYSVAPDFGVLPLRKSVDFTASDDREPIACRRRY